MLIVRVFAERFRGRAASEELQAWAPPTRRLGAYHRPCQRPIRSPGVGRGHEGSGLIGHRRSWARFSRRSTPPTSSVTMRFATSLQQRRNSESGGYRARPAEGSDPAGRRSLPRSRVARAARPRPFGPKSGHRGCASRVAGSRLRVMWAGQGVAPRVRGVPDRSSQRAVFRASADTSAAGGEGPGRRPHRRVRRREGTNSVDRASTGAPRGPQPDPASWPRSRAHRLTRSAGGCGAGALGERND